MRIAVFGAGAVGSLVGSLLSRSHQVTLVARPAHVEAVRTTGLRVTGMIDRIFQPEATTELPTSVEFDIVIVTVKAYDTKGAIHQVRERIGPRTLVVSLQNGLNNEESYLEAFGERAVLGTTSMGATILGPGRVLYAGEGETVFGSPAGVANAEAVSRVFEDAGLPSRLGINIMAELWIKGAVNAGLNPITAIAHCRNGLVAEDPDLRTVALAACREAVMVAQAEGIDLPSDPLQRLLDVARATSTNTSSMLADIQIGRRTEIEEINGEVVRRAQDHGLEVPVNRVLLHLVRAISRRSRDGAESAGGDGNATDEPGKD
jgi:2-dehydropantoate 2-reductase